MKILKIQSLRIFLSRLKVFLVGSIRSSLRTALAGWWRRRSRACRDVTNGATHLKIGLGALQEMLELGVKGFADISPCSRATAHFRYPPPSPVTLLTADLATVAKRRMTSRSCGSATTDPNTTRIELGTLQTMPDKVLGSDLQDLEIRHFSFKS